jgi:hypothetical protein
MDDDSELRLEVLHMAFDLLMTHGAFGVQDALNVADVLTYYVTTGQRPEPPQQPTLN